MGTNGTFMKIGWRYILPVWGVTLFVLVFSDEVLLNLFLITASFLVAYLFYVPERVAPETSKSAVLSPIDGTVLSIKSHEEGTSIMLRKSIFDGSSAVRAPVSGEITEKKGVHGLFLGAGNPLASKLNEKGSISWKTAGGESVTMKMVCGLYALGVPMFASESVQEASDTVAHLTDGTVELLLPKKAKMEVAPGDKVLGGYSLLAYGNA